MKYFYITLLLLLVSVPGYAGTVSANHTLVRGTIVSESDVKVDLKSGENREQLLTGILGQEVKRTVYAGQAFNASSVGAPILVRRNSRVTMIYKFGTMEITVFGRALEEGAAGDNISIMNLDSRQRVSGTVRRAGFVEVTL